MFIKIIVHNMYFQYFSTAIVALYQNFHFHAFLQNKYKFIGIYRKKN